MNSETITILLIVTLGFTTHNGLMRPDVTAKYLFSAEGIRLRRQWIRLVSPAFLHADWGHFAANAITIYFFGGVMESTYGAGMMLGTFFLSVAGGSAICLLLHRREEYRALGASGGALGLIFATIFLLPGLRIGFFLIPVRLPAWIYAIGYLLYTLQGLRNSRGNISHEGHLGGLITGVLVALLHNPRTVLAQSWLLAVVLVFSGAGIWYFHANPGRVPGFLRWRLRMAVGDLKRKKSKQDSEEIDRLLDKVARDGIHSLSARERARLEEASKQRREGR